MIVFLQSLKLLKDPRLRFRAYLIGHTDSWSIRYEKLTFSSCSTWTISKSPFNLSLGHVLFSLGLLISIKSQQSVSTVPLQCYHKTKELEHDTRIAV
jgi:hypothetical protein